MTHLLPVEKAHEEAASLGLAGELTQLFVLVQVRPFTLTRRCGLILTYPLSTTLNYVKYLILTVQPTVHEL